MVRRKRTKIIATIGPSSHAVPTLVAMAEAGMDAARLNFSHGTHASHRRLYGAIRTASRQTGIPLAVLADLQGPKIRLGVLAKPFSVKKGQELALPIDLPNAHRFLKRGASVLIDDGKIEGTYLRGSRGIITVRFSSAAVLDSHMGVAFPGVVFKGLPALTAKDKEDARFAVALGVEWIVLSFVSSAEDVKTLRRFLAKGKGKLPRIMAKIERRAAVTRLASIVKESDGIMIGRGDLALDVEPEEVPQIQRAIIDACVAAGKPVVVATQMLESMVSALRPSRADVSDIAHAVMDHTDAVMLSGESAKGRYPVEAVEMMSRVIERAEHSPYDDVLQCELPKKSTKAQALAFALAHLIAAKRVQAVVVHEEDRALVADLIRYRPEVPVYLFGAHEKPLREELVRWGVIPVVVPSGVVSMDEKALARALKHRGMRKSGQTITVLGYHEGEPTFSTIRL